MELVVAGREAASGVTVNPTTAMNCATVYSCVRILAETVASLPLPLYRRLQPRGKQRAGDHPLYSILHDQPNPEMTSFEFRETLQGHAALWGNAYAQIVRDRDGQVMALWPLRPDRMQVKRDDGKRLVYVYRLPDGDERTFQAYEIFHLRGLSGDGIIGYSPIRAAQEAIGLALATEEFGARFFSNDARPGVVLKHPNSLSQTAHENLRNSWKARHAGLKNAHEPAILEEGMDIKEIGIPPEDAQFLATRQFQIAEIARFFRVPLYLLNEHDKAATYASVEQFALQFVVHTVRPWLVRWEQAINSRLLTVADERDYFAEFLVNGLLRGDIKSRYEAYAVGRNNGWLSANDIREMENLNPLPGDQGDQYLVPLNMVPADQAGKEASNGGNQGQAV